MKTIRMKFASLLVTVVVFGSQNSGGEEPVIVNPQPIGISLEVVIDKNEGNGRPIVILKNNTSKPITYLAKGGTGGWKVKVFSLDGTLIGSEGYEPFKQGSMHWVTVTPGECGRKILDIRWGVMNDQNIPDSCRVEIETPSFSAPAENLAAKVVIPMALKE